MNQYIGVHISQSTPVHYVLRKAVWQINALKQSTVCKRLYNFLYLNINRFHECKRNKTHEKQKKY